MKFPKGNYDTDQLDILKIAFEQACEELGLSEDDKEGRETLARALMDQGQVGRMDPAELKSFAISRYWREAASAAQQSPAATPEDRPRKASEDEV